MKIFTLIFLFLFGLCSQASATPLSTAAAALAPGSWVKVIMSNVNITGDFPAWDPSGNNGPGFDSWQPAWDSTGKKIYIITAEHNVSTTCPGPDGPYPSYRHVCFKPMWTYDDATDTWNIGATGTWTGNYATSQVTLTGVFPHEGTNTPVNTFHAWNLPAWDNVNKVLYLGGSYNLPSQGYRYCVSNTTPSWCVGKGGQWTKLPTRAPERAGNSPQAAVFHEGLNAGTGGTLLYYDGDGYGPSCGGLYGYRDGVGGGTWSVIREVDCSIPGNGNIPSISHNTLAFYSHVKQIAVFGGGSIFYKIDNVGTITRLDNSPFALNTTNPGFAMPSEDPVSGDFYIIASKNPSQLIKLNPTAATGSQWTVIDANLNTAGKICNVLRDTNAECALDVYATPISTYGVIGYWKYLRGTPNTAEYWIYKATASGGDVIFPTVSITAPTTGATVSGAAVTLTATASDNIGVVGVQFKIDGVATGAEDTAAPYSISWNSTTATNGSHTITATARDAAGNSTTSTGVSVTVSNVGGGSDFATRCALPGVLVCEGFDSASVISNTQNGPQGINNLGTTLPTIDTTVKASGAGSLKLTVPSLSSANSSGNYWRNFSNDNLTQFGGNADFYVQWRQRFTSCFLFNGAAEPCTGTPRHFAGGGGWKLAHIGTGDKTGCGPSNSAPCSTSCSDLEAVPQNTQQRGFAHIYQGCPSSTPTNPYTGDFGGINSDVSINGGADFYLQNVRPSPFCLYSQNASGSTPLNYFPPTGNCFGFFPDEWLTYQVRIQTGTRTANANGHDYFLNSHVQVWMAREGQPAELVIDWTNVPLHAGVTGLNDQFGKVWLNNYNTGKDDTVSNPAAAVWYDELIVRNGIRIPDPSATPDTTNPTVAITSPIPPTTSTTVSPITVSGTATDNISVTSVTWTCIQCVTKGGTATSSPGTSISWLIPALDLVSGTNVVNVVAHDAAGNVSTAATLTIAYAPSSTYWVSKLGNDSNGCTSSNAPLTTTAKLTIAAGLTCLSAGNTLFIRVGSYNERLTNVTSNIPGGSSWATATTIAGYPTETVEIKPTSIAATNVLDLRRPSQLSNQINEWIIWQDLIFDGTNVVGGFANIIYVGQSHNRFSRVTLRNQGAAGTDHQVSAAMSIGGDDISGPVIGTEFTHGSVHDNSLIVGVDNGADAGYGFYDSYTTGTIIENSDIYRNGAYGIHGYHSSGHHQSATYRFNRLWDNQMYGINGESAHILASSGNNHRVYGNVMWSTGTTVGPQSNLLNGIMISTTSGTVVVNNTVYNMPRDGITTYNASTTSATVSNNIIVGSNQNNGVFVNFDDSGTGTTKASNLCNGTGGTTNCNYTTDPLFVNPTGVPPNFRIGVSSQANNTGVNLGSTYSPDIAGVARPGSPAPWDLGAYEFVATFQPVVTIVNPTANATLGVSQPLFSLGGTSNLP